MCFEALAGLETKYLGVIIEESLTFGEHLNATAKIIRMLIYLFGNLRMAADVGLLYMTYKALCPPLAVIVLLSEVALES